MSSEKTEEPSLEELRQTLRDAEEKLRRIEVRVAAKKKLIEYKNKEKFTITLIERKIKDCQKGNASLDDARALIKIDKENQEVIKKLTAEIAQMDENK